VSSRCLGCQGTLGPVLFSIPNLPLVDSFAKTATEARKVPGFSIEISQCTQCLTIQVVNPPDTSEIYRNYIYESSSSPDLKGHFISYVNYVHSLGISRDSRVLEVGANDGLLLAELQKFGFMDLTGIDPSPQTAAITIPGVKIINDFFSPKVLGNLGGHQYQLIIANNCFSHIPDLRNILALCRELLSDDGRLVVEVQSTLDLIQALAFDYIYHEHFFYHTVTSFRLLAKMAGLEVYDVTHVPTKGGSYRLCLGKDGKQGASESVDYWVYRERLAGVHSQSSWLSMGDYLDRVRPSLQARLSDFSRPVSAYGASATGTVFLRYMDLEGIVSFIVDDNPKRQGHFSPGAAIPVRPASALAESGVCLVLAWRHIAKIAPKLDAIGLPYLTPLPILESHG
jgi:SAM-dependent methyltransferase